MAKSVRPKFVLFGDSITQLSFNPDDGGWGASLADLYCRKADIVVRGYSGYNTRWALYLLDEIFPKTSESPSVVTVFFGANDAVMPDRSAKRQHVPISEYKSNLHHIISHLKGLAVPPQIILITPPPIEEQERLIDLRTNFGMDEKLPERTDERAGLYAEACKDVAAEAGVHVIDVWSIFHQDPNWKKLLCDGLHLSHAGNMVVYEQVRKVLNSVGLGEQQLQIDYPLHSDINEDHPELSFKAFN